MSRVARARIGSIFFFFFFSFSARDDRTRAGQVGWRRLVIVPVPASLSSFSIFIAETSSRNERAAGGGRGGVQVVPWDSSRLSREERVPLPLPLPPPQKGRKDELRERGFISRKTCWLCRHRPLRTVHYRAINTPARPPPWPADWC